jgi:DNA-binding GntR family transcriptional regulator
MPPRSAPVRPASSSERGARYATEQELVYRSLREAIMRCELAPGQRLVIDDLARRLNVSAIPVREALHMLSSERLVVNVPHVGATVAPIAPDSVHEVFAVMEGLELVAARAAAQNMTPADGLELDQIVAGMDRAQAAGRHAEWADLNSRFHLAISRLSAMPMLHEMTERVLARWDRVRRFYFNGVLVHRIEQAQREHRDLVAAMRAGDFAALERTVKDHNRGAHQAYAEFIKRAVD